jgi:hypothetical protein
VIRVEANSDLPPRTHCWFSEEQHHFSEESDSHEFANSQREYECRNEEFVQRGVSMATCFCALRTRQFPALAIKTTTLQNDEMLPCKSYCNTHYHEPEGEVPLAHGELVGAVFG